MRRFLTVTALIAIAGTPGFGATLYSFGPRMRPH